MRIPARIAGIAHLVCKKPVTAPAAAPAAIATIRDSQGFTPIVIIVAQIEPPRAKLPSTVRSAISSTLYVIYTPRAMIPQSTPWLTAP